MGLYTNYHKICCKKLRSICRGKLTICYNDVAITYPIRSKTKLTTAIKDFLEEANEEVRQRNDSEYLANLMRVIIYLTEIRDAEVGNKTFNGRRDYNK